MGSKKRGEFVDSLRLSQQEQDELLEAMDNQSDGHRGSNLRRDERVPYRRSSGVVVTLVHPGGSVARYLVRPRNLSRCGMGFLHGGFVHEGSKCQVHLQKLDSTPHVIMGAVARCQHVTGMVHEIGVRLEEEIDLAIFTPIQSAPGPELADQSEELPQLAGKLLYLDSTPDGRQFLKFHAEAMGVAATVVSDPLAAIELIRGQQYEMLLLQNQLPGMTGLECTEILRKSGYRGPIVLMAGAAEDPASFTAKQKGCSEVLMPPMTLRLLIEILRKYMSEDVGPAESDRALSA